MRNVNIRKGRMLVLGSVVAIFLMNIARADSLIVNINSGAIVTDGERSDARLLINISLPDELLNGDLIFAELRIPVIAVIPDSSVLIVHCNPLMITWNPDDIAWEDFGDSLTNDVVGEDGTIYAASDAGEQAAYFDITEIVRAWTGGGLSNNGLILYSDPVSLPRFAVNREDGAPLARVAFTFEP